MMPLQLIGAHVELLEGPRYNPATIAGSAEHGVSLAAACPRTACMDRNQVAGCLLDGPA